MDRDLERSLEALEAAMDPAGSGIERQLESIDEGIFEDDAGESTQQEPGPKIDRIEELSTKLDALQEETDDPVVRERIGAARDHLRTYMKREPQGG